MTEMPTADDWPRWRKSLDDALASAALNKAHLERVVAERDRAVRDAVAAERRAIVGLMRDLVEECREHRPAAANTIIDVIFLIEKRDA